MGLEMTEESNPSATDPSAKLQVFLQGKVDFNCSPFPSSTTRGRHLILKQAVTWLRLQHHWSQLAANFSQLFISACFLEACLQCTLMTFPLTPARLQATNKLGVKSLFGESSQGFAAAVVLRVRSHSKNTELPKVAPCTRPLQLKGT